MRVELRALSKAECAGGDAAMTSTGSSQSVPWRVLCARPGSLWFLSCLTGAGELTGPIFCTSRCERCYITTSGCETGIQTEV